MNQINVKIHTIFFSAFPSFWKKFSLVPIQLTLQPPQTSLLTKLGREHTSAMANLTGGDKGHQYFNLYCCKNFLISDQSNCQEKSHLSLVIAESYRKLVAETVSSPHFICMTGLLVPCTGKLL